MGIESFALHLFSFDSGPTRTKWGLKQRRADVYFFHDSLAFLLTLSRKGIEFSP